MTQYQMTADELCEMLDAAKSNIRNGMFTDLENADDIRKAQATLDNVKFWLDSYRQFLDNKKT